MSPNASLLSLLTISAEAIDYVFFAYLKELNELAPPGEPFWYDKKGAKNNATFLWPEKKIKQWLVIGEDKTIATIFQALIANNAYIKSMPGYPDIQFRLNPTFWHQIENNHLQVGDIPIFSKSRHPVLYRQEEPDAVIPFLLDEKNNCDFISGYAHNEIIKPITPAGLLPEQYLFEKLNNQINAVRQQRDIYCDFAEKTNRSTGKIKLKGFIQMDGAFKTNHILEARNIDGTRIIGKTNIDVNKGTWEIPLDNNDGRGQLRIADKLTETTQYAEQYTILRNLNIIPHIAATLLKDAFGREIMMGKEITTSPSISDQHWELSAAPDRKQAAIELNDKIVSVLSTLGKQIRIVDPYFLGPIIEQNSKITVPNISQQVFLNALLVAIGQNGITSIIIQGFHKNTGKHDGIDAGELTNQYKLLWQLIQNTYRGTSLLKLTKLELAKTKNSFHDRYWMSDEPHAGLIYDASNSINGPFENGEWNCLQLGKIAGVKKRTLIYQEYIAAEKTDLML